MGICCNPYGVRHTQKQNRGAKKISDLARCRELFPRFAWAEGQLLCVGCRMKMLKEHKHLQILKAGVQLTRKKAARPDPNLGQPTADNDSDLENEDNIAVASPESSGDQNEQEQDAGRLYPQLPAVASSSHHAIAQQDVFQDDVSPSAPTQDLVNQNMPEQPGTSASFLARQPAYNPQMTPTRGYSDSETQHSDESSSDESGAVKTSIDLNRSLQEDVISPIQPMDIRRPEKLRRKFKKWRKRASDTILRATGIQASPQVSKNKPCVYCNKVFNELCDKYKEQESKTDKYKVLTSIPTRFSIVEVVEKSGCSNYIAKKASKLKNRKGAFSWPPSKRGKPMSSEHEEIVRDYYKKDETSRASPNETILVKIDGGRRPIAKRRILHNLNDLYQEFKREYPHVQISISKFCKLRPRNCVWPGLRGHHVTCVCETHQNFEFFLEAMDRKASVQKFVRQAVCENDNGELRPDCHFGICNECPKSQYLEFLLERVRQNEAVSYTQWVRTDSTDVKNITVSIEEFESKFMEYVPRIIEHEYVTRKQNTFIKQLRENRVKNSASITVQVDFAQNYTFIVQNAVQGYHWSNKQASIHPFVVHYFDSTKNKVVYKTYCIISDEMAHDADTFHVFRNAVMPQIKVDLNAIPIKKIYYVSDGCAGQYKGVKNFANLMLHKEDYGIDAEWHFCSTAHGKSTCDAISAVVKCSARRESLIRGQFITEPHLLFNYCEARLTTPKLRFFYVTKEQVSAARPALFERYKPFKPIKGTRKHHVFIPRPNGVMLMGRTSDSELLTEVDFRAVEVTDFTSDNVSLGTFYAFFEEGNYHAGLLVEEDSDEGDLKFQVLKLNRNTRIATWPDPLIFTDVAFRDVLLRLKEPETRDGFHYEINKDDMSQIRARNNLRKLKLTTRM